MSDRLEIEGVVIRYTRAIDTGDWDKLDTVFTADAEIDYTESGGIADTYPAVKTWLAEVLPAFFPKRMHSLAQIDITFRSERATTRCARRTSTTRCRWTTARAARRSSSSAGSTITR